MATIDSCFEYILDNELATVDWDDDIDQNTSASDEAGSSADDPETDVTEYAESRSIVAKTSKQSWMASSRLSIGMVMPL